jgi:hypothetical protein
MLWDIILNDEVNEGRFPVTHLFTAENDDTNDSDEAFKFVAFRPDGKWAYGLVSSGQLVPRRHQ